MITEDQLEQLSLDWFRQTGWDYLNSCNYSGRSVPTSL